MGRHAFIPTFNARHAILSDQTRSCSLNNIESRPKDRPTSSRHCFSAPHSSQSSSRDQGETDRRSSRTRSANRTSIAPAQYNGFKQPLASLKEPLLVSTLVKFFCRSELATLTVLLRLRLYADPCTSSLAAKRSLSARTGVSHHSGARSTSS